MTTSVAAMSASAVPGCPAGHISARLVVLLVSLLLAAQHSNALPQLYIARIAQADCGNHPKQAYGQHQNPIADSTTTVSFTLADPQAVTAASPATVLCAGSSYSVKVEFGGQARNALITASVGSLQPSGQAAGLGQTVAQTLSGVTQNLGLLNLYTGECPGRYSTPLVTSAVELTLTLPIWATGNLVFQVTSASNARDNFKAAAANIPVLTPQQCSLRNSPSPSPRLSPSPRPSPSPSPSPLITDVTTLPLSPTAQIQNSVIVLPSSGGPSPASPPAPSVRVDLSSATDSDLQLLGQIAAASNASSLTAASSAPTGASSTTARSSSGVQRVLGLFWLTAGLMTAWLFSP